jgi:hypothetical protein
LKQADLSHPRKSIEILRDQAKNNFVSCDCEALFLVLGEENELMAFGSKECRKNLDLAI